MADSLKNIFKSQDLLQQALTHKSWVNEHPGRPTNERLEFLGDAILEFIVSEALYRKFPKKDEGYLTALRANLVNTKNLSQIGKKMRVGNKLLLSKGEKEAGGKDNIGLLANTMEAIIGALYLDQGLAKTREFIGKKLLADLEEKTKEPLKDAKSRLQEAIQAKDLPAPRYQVLEASGPDHQKQFVVGVFANGEILGKGSGKNKAEAEQRAADQALVKIGKAR